MHLRLGRYGDGVGGVDVRICARNAEDDLGGKRVLHAKLVGFDLTDGSLQGDRRQNPRFCRLESDLVKLGEPEDDIAQVHESLLSAERKPILDGGAD